MMQRSAIKLKVWLVKSADPRGLVRSPFRVHSLLVYSSLALCYFRWLRKRIEDGVAAAA